MKFRSPFLMHFGGLALAVGMRRWMETLDIRAALYDETVDPAHPRFRPPAIFVLWHEYIPFMLHLRGKCGIAALVGRHVDAEWLSQACRHLGITTVRGSSNRGGVAALRELMREMGRMSLVITPDGPRGPRRRLAPGAIYLASKLQIPIAPLGLGYDRPWRLNTWDRFAVPRPHSRARVVAGPFISVPSNLDRDGVAHYREYVETLLNTLTTEAEQWAAASGRMKGEQVMRHEVRSRKGGADSRLFDLPGRGAELSGESSRQRRAA